MKKSEDGNERRLVSLGWIAGRWDCSRQTCRRVLQKHGVKPLYLGGDVQNATVRFDREDVLAVERKAQALATDEARTQS